jgi:hypothetical protein
MVRPTVHVAMNTQQEATLEVSFPKALLVSAIGMACFFVGILGIGIPMRDPLLVGFLIFMGFVMPFVFAGCLCFILPCKIGQDGLRPAVPTFYQRLLRWEDIVAVSGFGCAFYSVRCRAFGPQCLLPRGFLLKRRDSLREFIQQYAPEDNIVRKTLAA